MSKLESILGKILNINPLDINDATSPQNTPAWDSMNGLLMITELEKEYNLRFTMDEVLGVKNVEDIKRVLTKHNVDLSNE